VTTILEVLFSLGPVSFFLAGLIFLDSYKLVPLRTVLLAIFVGICAALLALLLHARLIAVVDMDRAVFLRYVAPITEELLKSVYLLFLIRSYKVGFAVDAAILGFSIGTGFALVENLHYMRNLADPPLVVWFIRGFGTAILHGSTTAIVGIISHSFLERQRRSGPQWLLPGLATAIVLHSLFNHFPLPPLVMTLLILLVMPTLVLWVFRRSEKATQHWLGSGLDADMEIIESLRTGEIRQSPIGEYLQSLKEHFSGAIVADMLCLLQIQIELSMQAKAILLAREAGLDLPMSDEIRSNLAELAFLEKNIGPTGRLALEPFLRNGRQDIWQLHMLNR
jgi:RsiW-degrading membrane proteinase PrsW (M82 family)